jgi:hypothetical protein
MPINNFIRFATVNVFIAIFVVAAGWQSAAAREAPVTSGFAALSKQQQAMLDDVEKRTFEFFRDSASSDNGQVPDHWLPDAPGDHLFSSTAAVGFGLTAYAIGAERGWMTRAEAVKRTLVTLHFFSNAEQDETKDASGAHGFFYHFLDMKTGKRFRDARGRGVELSSVDTSWLMYGVLFAKSYYDRDNKDEKEIRGLADGLFRRVDWKWFTDGNPLVEGGWTPEKNFDYNYYHGYSEALGLYILALGSPTHSLGAESWKRWTQTYDGTWGDFEGQTHLGGGPLFWDQYTQSWIDFRGIQDDYMRQRGIDYFTNSQRAALSQREYAIQNPMQWKDYGANIWGLTASNGPRGGTTPGEPNPCEHDVKRFYGYIARGVGLHYSVDDGTIAPTAAVSSIAFTPEIVIPLIAEMRTRYGDDLYGRYGFVDAFNPSFTFTERKLRTGKVFADKGWFDTYYIGIDQGPIVLMLENYRSEFVWKVMRKNPYIQAGLKKAGFRGGWLDAVAARK